MKRARPSDPTRWRDSPADTQALEARAAALADAAAQVSPLGPQALSRIRNQVLARRRPTGSFALPRKLVLAVWLLIVCATTAGGASALWRRYVDTPGRMTPPVGEKAAPPVPRPAARVSSRSAEPEALPVAEAPPVAEALPAVAKHVIPDEQARRSEAPVRTNSPATRPAGVEPPPLETPPQLMQPAAPTRQPPSPAQAPAPPASFSEAGFVAQALMELRQHRDARAALSTLDRYDRAFPRGVLEAEAFRTRVEAQVRLGDLKAVLGLLDKPPAAGGDVLGANLLLTRAELRADAGRFQEALVDFTELLGGHAGPLTAGDDERALYGRAVCFGRLEQHQSARAALLTYRERYPNGRFAGEVDRLLGGSVSAPHP